MIREFYVADAYKEIPDILSRALEAPELVLCNFILTDPLYDLKQEKKDWLDWMFHQISVNGALVFCPWDNPFFPIEEVTHQYFWTKPLSTKNYTKMKRPSNFVELVQYKQIKPVNRVWNGADYHWSMSTNIAKDIINRKDLHPWRKPLSLIKRFIRLYTNRGDTVLDPFAGSGVVAEACLELGRGFICFDNDAKLVEETKHRLHLEHLDN